MRKAEQPDNKVIAPRATEKTARDAMNISSLSNSRGLRVGLERSHGQTSGRCRFLIRRGAFMPSNNKKAARL
ncbi:hypothetical protein EMIT0P228_10390 [Pseudomonas brassicacearum]